MAGFFSPPPFHGYIIDEAFLKNVDLTGPIFSLRVYFPGGPTTSAIYWLNGKSTLYDHAESETHICKINSTPLRERKLSG